MTVLKNNKQVYGNMKHQGSSNITKKLAQSRAEKMVILSHFVNYC